MARLSEKFKSSLRKKDMKRKQRMSFDRHYDKKIKDTVNHHNNGDDELHNEACTFSEEWDARADATKNLMNAIHNNNLEKVVRALKNGASLRHTSAKKYSPIELAHQQKLWEIKKLLAKEISR